MKKFPENEKVLENQSFGLDSDSVSHNECTGLVPFEPMDESELESYSKIQNYSPRAVSKEK